MGLNSITWNYSSESANAFLRLRRIIYNFVRGGGKAMKAAIALRSETDWEV